MKIGILTADEVRAELAADFGQYPGMIAGLLDSAGADIEYKNYATYLGEYPDYIDEVDAYVISGSRYSVYDDQLWIHNLISFVQALHARKKKLVGLCFGHQLVAQALGGLTEKSPNGWSVGVQSLVVNESARDYVTDNTNFTVIANHQDQVIKPAAEAIVLAGNELCPIAMCGIGEHILTFQGHPEFSTDFARAFFGIRRPQYTPEQYEQAIASLKVPADSDKIAAWIIEFVKR